MARRRSKKKVEITGLGDGRLVLVALILALLAFFLEDFFGFRYLFVGSYIWLIVFLMWFTIRLFYLAQFVLPLKWHDSWFEGLRLAFRFNFPALTALSQRKIPKLSRAKKSKAVAGDYASSFAEHRAGLVPSHQALTLERGQSFSRAAGPGYVKLNKGEKIGRVLDLRNHFRTLSVSALSKDGIPVDTSVSVVFHIKRLDSPIDPQLPYPYDPDAIFKVSYVDSFSSGNGSVSWTERVIRQAASALVNEISRFPLNELLSPDPGGAHPLEKIKTIVHERLTKTFDKHGIKVVSVGVGRLTLPEDVLAQRIDNWRATWEAKLQAKNAKGEGDVRWLLARTRAAMQISLIASITNSVSRIQQKRGVDLSEVVVMRILEAVEEAAMDEDVRALVPQQTISTLRQIQSMVDEWGA